MSEGAFDVRRRCVVLSVIELRKSGGTDGLSGLRSSTLRPLRQEGLS